MIKEPTDRHNSVLTNEAYKLLMQDLLSFGNRPDQNHCDALYALLRTMTEMSENQREGRYAFGLPTGMGKTQSIIAWVTALNQLALDDVSVSVSASKVEALCELKKALMMHGVPEEKIGLLHSYQHEPNYQEDLSPLKDGYASLPSTDKEERQIMLVTHNRLRGSTIDDSFHMYKGKQRDLMLYDESLIVSDSVGINFKDLKGDIGRLSAMYDENNNYHEVINFVVSAQELIQTNLDELKDNERKEVRVIELDIHDDQSLQRYKDLLKNVSRVDRLQEFIEICHCGLRVMNIGEAGVVTYNMVVPEEIKNIIVLDASYPIRKLIHLDETIKDAEKSLPYMKSLGVSLHEIKRFDKVIIKHMRAAGGRDSMTKEFDKPHSERKVTIDVCNVVSDLPKDESVLIFVYKKRGGSGIDFDARITQALSKVGVGCDETVDYLGKQRKRVNIVTWGMETSLNNYSHCEHVILVGVMHRSKLDLSGSMVGQSDDLELNVSSKDISEIERSEKSHLIYQSISRGVCRIVEDGFAKPMTIYLIDKDKGLKEELNKVMPNVQWEEWEGNYSQSKSGVIDKTARLIRDYLEACTLTKVSINQLKKELKLDVPARTFTHARNYCIDNLTSKWMVEGRSLVTIDHYFSL